MADDLGLVDLSYAGSSVVSTPHLDTLARRSVLLSNFRTPTWCAPSRAAYLTGRHGWEIGMASAFGWTAIGRDSLMLPSLLKELSYRTAIIGKLHLNLKTCTRFPTGGQFGCGFDHQYGFVGGMSDYYNHHRTWSRNGEPLRELGYATELLASEAERVVRGHAHGEFANRSLFLWLSLSAPHTPLQAPQEWIARQRPDLEPHVRTYAAMVGAMDDAFGRTTAALRAAGMLPSTLLLFMSDNGGPIIPSACNGGLRGGKGSPYEGGVRAPALVHWPACLGRAQHVSRLSTHMVDIFATIVAAASIGQPAEKQQKLAARLKKKAPHSIALWNGLAASSGSSIPASPNADPADFMRRLLVLQASASSSSVLRGRWKLVLANRRCFGLAPGASHEEKVAGFPADRWLLARQAADEDPAARLNKGGQVGGGTIAASSAGAATSSPYGRRRMARAAGIELQLYDLHADPAEKVDLLSASSSSLTPPAPKGHRNLSAVAEAMLGHYLTAAKAGRKAIDRAFAEGRVTRDQMMVVWFCRQVEHSWTTARWAAAQRMMCAGRTERERQQITALPRLFPATSAVNLTASRRTSGTAK